VDSKTRALRAPNRQTVRRDEGRDALPGGMRMVGRRSSARARDEVDIVAAVGDSSIISLGGARQLVIPRGRRARRHEPAFFVYLLLSARDRASPPRKFAADRRGVRKSSAIGDTRKITGGFHAANFFPALLQLRRAVVTA